MKKSRVSEWHKLFKHGHENVKDNERSGRTRSHRTNENVEKVQNLVHSDVSRRTAMAVRLNLDEQTMRQI